MAPGDTTVGSRPTYHKDPDAQYFARAITDIYAALSRQFGNSSDQSGVKQSGESNPETHILVLTPHPNQEVAPDYETANSGTKGKHIYSVTKVGGRYKSRFDVKSNRDENEIVSPNEEKCAENVMAALADFDKEKLNAILDLADQEAKNLELHKKIQSEIEQYIKGCQYTFAAFAWRSLGRDSSRKMPAGAS